ncbi:MAG: hypothetical protein ACFE9L_09880 [Candidatus Hodarchaeota archaeon]
MKQLIDQIRSTVAFCGFEVESIASHKSYVSFDLKSKSRFRKKNYLMAVSKSLNGLLTAERELSRNSRNQKIIILDPVNNLLKPTLGNVELFHDLDQLQGFLSK